MLGVLAAELGTLVEGSLRAAQRCAVIEALLYLQARGEVLALEHHAGKSRCDRPGPVAAALPAQVAFSHELRVLQAARKVVVLTARHCLTCRAEQPPLILLILPAGGGLHHKLQPSQAGAGGRQRWGGMDRRHAGCVAHGCTGRAALSGRGHTAACR